MSATEKKEDSLAKINFECRVVPVSAKKMLNSKMTIKV
jgi:hypothetical protein